MIITLVIVCVCVFSVVVPVMHVVYILYMFFIYLYSSVFRYACLCPGIYFIIDVSISLFCVSVLSLCG